MEALLWPLHESALSLLTRLPKREVLGQSSAFRPIPLSARRLKCAAEVRKVEGDVGRPRHLPTSPE